MSSEAFAKTTESLLDSIHLSMKYELEPFHRDISDEELLADLRRVAEELGKKRVTFREYRAKGRFAPQTLAERFAHGLPQLIKLTFGGPSIGIFRTKNFS